ncbi:Starch-binding associating with outer membrane [Mucilaginibacter mallensis]|uniref:Starch-binding associating with outer membrane n=1 Tax=Mucilaginibacter mallensis TaxID=652787 RepID=A0A1H2BQR8_MUCMA|nr:SusD/RagB family nutrient-binding outer membrane lipoprotein [Mucilaginibacter mallensis]SDT60700.1 Starch-binding associating with outer membrane [Mucilaginibacter mallensis]
MKKTIILLFITSVFASGCKKYLDVNNNPNQPTVVTPNVVLSAALTGSANAMGTDFLNVNRYMGYWSRSGNYVSDPINEQYQFNNSMTDNDWATEYTTLNRYHYIETAGTINGLPFYVGVAKVMEALHFSRLVDIYGNVPYSQAFNPTKYQTPKYDDAATIYGELITKLDSAVTVFQAATAYYKIAPKTQITTDDQYDLIFGRGAGVAPATRMTEWIQFANTLKLSLLLHENAIITTAYRTAEIAKITANGAGYLPAGLSAAVNPGYSNTSNKQNPFYAIFETPTAVNVQQGYFRANTYAINFGINTGDERQNFFYGAPYASTGFPEGNYDGDPKSNSNSSTSQISGDGNQAAFGVTITGATGTLKSSLQDQLILSDFESLFIQAEAAQRGWITGDAGTFYKEAVEQNFVYLNAQLFEGSPIAEADYYLQGTHNANPGLIGSVNDDTYSYFPGSSNPLGVILTQKWAALNSINWVEAWTGYRRSGYPVKSILDISHATTHVQNAIPTRYLYPQSELNTNAANVPVITAPAQYGKIFWDK